MCVSVCTVIVVRSLLGIQGEWTCVFESDGSLLTNDVLEAILEAGEKVEETLMLLEAGQEWSKGQTL